MAQSPVAHLISSMMAFIALGLMFSFVLAACIVAPGRYACAHTAPASVHASPHPECVEARAWLVPYLRQRESSCTSRCGAVARRATGVAARADAPVVAEPSHRAEQVLPSPAELAAQASRLSCCTRLAKEASEVAPGNEGGRRCGAGVTWGQGGRAWRGSGAAHLNTV